MVLVRVLEPHTLSLKDLHGPGSEVDVEEGAVAGLVARHVVEIVGDGPSSFDCAQEQLGVADSVRNIEPEEFDAAAAAVKARRAASARKASEAAAAKRAAKAAAAQGAPSPSGEGVQSPDDVVSGIVSEVGK